SKTEGCGFDSLHSCHEVFCQLGWIMSKSNIFSKALRFYHEVKAEGKKVTWATRKDVTMTSLFVFVLALIAAIFFIIVDTGVHRALKLLNVVG
ncbi:MAG: preprotein translocase subunit SecE, partial [Alphaproteobacteria bacterium]|nr:preprotein translocase subunit SecE [Alphaproteobacteria bacterium]